MASITRRTALTLLRPTSLPLRSHFATSTPPPPPPSTDSSSKSPTNDSAVTAPLSPEPKDKQPKYSPPAVFPAPVNPYDLPAQPAPTPEQKPSTYSSTQQTLVRGLARMMGYNSKASTAIRETSRMMKGIVEAVERDRDFWYDECRLPPTYQTFFQLHLLYVLILVPRLRGLPASLPSHSHPIPEPAEPGPPQHTAPPSSTGSSVSAMLTKPLHEAYVSELVNHFFELAESQMRRVLGRGERERVVKNYMAEMGEQWRGAGVGLDYAMGLQLSSEPAEIIRADAEMASWVWRNLFGGRGTGAPAPGLVDPDMLDQAESMELEMPEQLEKVVRFLRREQARLDSVSHRDVVDGNLGTWGSVQEA